MAAVRSVARATAVLAKAAVQGAKPTPLVWGSAAVMWEGPTVAAGRRLLSTEMPKTMPTAASPSTPSASSLPEPPTPSPLSPSEPDIWQGMLPDLSDLCPQRYVPDEVLRFKTVAYMDSGTYIPFPSEEGIDPRAFTTSPANFKVELTVSMKDLKLTDREKMRLRCLVGSRYNVGKGEIRLVSTRFMNRGHNAHYLVYLLENLVAEARGVAAPSQQHQQQQQEAVA